MDKESSSLMKPEEIKMPHKIENEDVNQEIEELLNRIYDKKPHEPIDDEKTLLVEIIKKNPKILDNYEEKLIRFYIFTQEEINEIRKNK